MMMNKYINPLDSTKLYTCFFIVVILFCPSWVFLAAMAENRSGTTTIPVVKVGVGVVVDTAGSVGKMGLSCINLSLSDFYASHAYYKTRLLLHVKDSNKDVVAAAAAALDLIKNGQVQAIIGPETSMQANFVINLGEKAHVPIISYSATSPSLTSLRSPYFFRLTQNDSAQVNAISAIVQAFNWRQAVPIYIDNEYGEGVIPFLTNALQQVNARVPYHSTIPPSATDDQISAELYKLMTMQTRVFIVHMTPGLGSRLFTIAKQIGMMSRGYAWIITDGMANVLNSLDHSIIDSMQGVLGVKTYIPKKKEYDEFRVRWRRKYLQDYPAEVDAQLNVFGLWAYDAITALTVAVEKVGSTNFGFQMKNVSSSSTDLENFGVSQNGEKLREALLSTRFRGFTGDFSIDDNGQLQDSKFEIINVNGNGERGIGFWTSKNGIIRAFGNSTNTSTYSTSKKNLGPIIWPGETSSVPKGWEIPTNGKKLRIGVPVKQGFREFVNIKYDLSTNTTEVTGYSIDVFKAVVDALPYAIQYEFIPFAKSNGERAGTYNDMIYQVFSGGFDAVVGDTTIIANRSQYVDFTLPYTESGVSMIVPVKDNRRKKAWVFLKPLTLDLWVTSACSFVFIGFVVWVLEHRINEDFRGPPAHQIGTSFWFSFSTLVFAHRERVVSNLARFVVIVWVFVVLILTQSYTASLTTMLTVEQLRPTVTDVNELLKKGMNVGYKEGSFVYGILKDHLGFQDSQLKSYRSADQLDELLTNGSNKGGIAVAFDEIPYTRLFLGTYCFKYTTAEPTFKTDGFGFVFPLGSPLVADMSRAILNVTEGDNMRNIEKAWFRKGSCSDPLSRPDNSASSLGLDSFWGLFLIACVASVSALFLFAIKFLYEHRHILLRNNPDTTIWRRIGILFRIFDHKDLSSHTFRKSAMQVKSDIARAHGLSAVETSPSTHYPSPTSRTESNFSFYGDQGMPSAESGDTNPYDEALQHIEASIVLAVPPATIITTTSEIAQTNNVGAD
ncbi:Glutamate receptor [Quillaja saponaria]|uniref:Glutamate receptor n=1 Tax=Quillaja saponaria TaxID=32244 RepID=A0AAD7PKQ4_QUISA|nr:Glutamate receptor [Quillaja saponaria]